MTQRRQSRLSLCATEAKSAEFKEHGIKIVYRSLNPSPENAREAEEAGADIIVFTGFDEGDMDNGYVSVGNGISHIHQIKSCQAIIDELTAHYAC